MIVIGGNNDKVKALTSIGLVTQVIVLSFVDPGKIAGEGGMVRRTSKRSRTASCMLSWSTI